ncbi:MAG: hypothetical protein J5497_04480 [Selenomonadaceae bacterium]|nr:hypothetical protein [Selenomonadaceae bacterium]
MADVIKSSSELSLVQEFTDGDTRTFTLENPDTSINLKDGINSLSSYMAENQITIGDKEGAAFQRIKSAKIVNTTLTYFDLTPQA